MINPLNALVKCQVIVFISAFFKFGCIKNRQELENHLKQKSLILSSQTLKDRWSQLPYYGSFLGKLDFLCCQTEANMEAASKMIWYTTVNCKNLSVLITHGTMAVNSRNYSTAKQRDVAHNPSMSNLTD